MSLSTPHNLTGRLLGTMIVVVLGVLLSSSFWQTCLSSRPLSSNFISPPTWMGLATSGRPASPPADSIELPFSATMIPCLAAAIATWISGALGLMWCRRFSMTEALIRWGWFGGIWWCLLDLWEWSWIIANASGSASVIELLAVTPQFWLAACLAGSMVTWTTIGLSPESSSSKSERPVRLRWLWLACGVYVVVFTTMNWRLYFNLLMPHGDSVMYEEHLWNLLHGKGFRSYLDQGLFLGEHIQFVHLFLLPVYVIWPSHLLLEACSTAALAGGAFPVFWMARRQTRSDRIALATAIAYLLYFPMQFLDIEIDLKTFRPESFGIPLLLLVLDQLDRKQLVGTVIAIAFCLTVKEDYSLILGPLGLWIALSRPAVTTPPSTDSARRWLLDSPKSRIAFGLSLSVFSVAYLWLATRVIMPWFRSGAEVHYASYFAKFGKSPEEIVRTMLTHPGLLFESLLTPETALYGLALLAPLAFLPLLSPGRLAVGLPLFGILCLNELEGSRTPQHQFHAPLVAILFWSLAGALPRAQSIIEAAVKRTQPAANALAITRSLLPTLIWSASLTTGLFFSLSPLGSPFWDPGSSWYWQRLYGPTPRAAMFARIADLIPNTARVASTDFVHPRYTHFERSYDYSEYQRKVSGTGKRIPDDTEYLVIDTQHRYSQIKHPSEVPEFREHPDQWDLVPDRTDGYFIVLKRKSKDAE